MKLGNITFILENCDWITIDGKYVNAFCVEDIRTSICITTVNSIDKMEIAHHFVIEISERANVDRYEFDQECEDFKSKLFDRLLNCNDITQVDFTLIPSYEKDSEKCEKEHYHYHLNWVGDDFNNAAQKSCLTKAGDLYILVDENNNVENGCIFG